MSLSDYFKNLPAPVQRSSLAVKSLQRERAAIQHEYNMACMVLEKQFRGKQQGLNRRRFEIITGSRPTPVELSAGAEDARKYDEDYSPPPLIASDTAAIPEFWLTVIRNHVELSSMVEEQDIPALQSLVDIQFSFLYPTGAKPDFKLEFKFKPNQFFTNSMLEKTYHYKNEPDEFGDFQPDRSVGMRIQWKGRKLVKNPGDDDGDPSFFDFFTPPTPPQKSNRSHDDDDEDEEEELEIYEEELEEDFTRGETFKDEVIPDAIDYFMQEKEEDDEDDDFELDSDKNSDDERRKGTDDDDDENHEDEEQDDSDDSLDRYGRDSRYRRSELS